MTELRDAPIQAEPAVQFLGRLPTCPQHSTYAACVLGQMERDMPAEKAICPKQGWELAAVNFQEPWASSVIRVRTVTTNSRAALVISRFLMHSDNLRRTEIYTLPIYLLLIMNSSKLNNIYIHVT